MQTYDHEVFQLAANLLVPTVYPAFACIAICEAAKELGHDLDICKAYSDKFYNVFSDGQTATPGSVLWSAIEHGIQGAYEQRIWALLLMAEMCNADPTLNV
jgi:hypothetical protein